jgi:hypothetical protein
MGLFNIGRLFRGFGGGGFLDTFESGEGANVSRDQTHQENVFNGVVEDLRTRWLFSETDVDTLMQEARVPFVDGDVVVSLRWEALNG